MTREEMLKELERTGMRLAAEDEQGYTDSYVNECGERVTIWVTETN